MLEKTQPGAATATMRNFTNDTPPETMKFFVPASQKVAGSNEYSKETDIIANVNCHEHVPPHGHVGKITLHASTVVMDSGTSHPAAFIA